jgi:hypothetical protein
MATCELPPSTIAQQIDIVPSSDDESTVWILRSTTSSTNEADITTKNHPTVEIAKIGLLENDNHFHDTFRVRSSLNVYIDTLGESAQACIQTAEGIASALLARPNYPFGISRKRRCRCSPFDPNWGVKRVAEDYDDTWYLDVRSPHRTSSRDENTVRLVRTRDCTIGKDCCWKCRTCRASSLLENAQIKPASKNLMQEIAGEYEIALPRRVLEIQRDAPLVETDLDC